MVIFIPTFLVLWVIILTTFAIIESISTTKAQRTAMTNWWLIFIISGGLSLFFAVFIEIIIFLK